MQSFTQQFNRYTQQGVPFFFLIDFEKKNKHIYTFDEAAKEQVYFDINGVRNYKKNNKVEKLQDLQFDKIDFKTYQKAFQQVQNHLQNGDTYLLNLTFATPIYLNTGLLQIYHQAKAPYKLYYQDKFTVFSPECFVKIEGNKIFSFPMKGTIDATIPDAGNKLLTDPKERFEHNTIVDLIRNDLSMVAREITVNKLKFLDKIVSRKGSILQMSSEIMGVLPDHWQLDAAGIFDALLPAGSISGAPKKKTLEIIKAVEANPRGYYTGIFGIFDGQNFDTAVAIRFIENVDNQLFYRSGGGITALSNLTDEYNELIQKIYVPTA